MGRRVRAAGGVVVRGDADQQQVLVVHRPRYDDWTFPKGKVDRGETEVQAAYREVWEETGFRCELLHELPSTNYSDAYGRPKTVRYWLMHPVGGEFAANDEVDAADWLSPDEARIRLTYDRDRELLGHLAD